MIRRKTDGKKLTYLLIILAITSIAVVPVLKSVMPSEIARWYLAAAMNAFDRKDDVATNELIHRARRWDSGIETDFNYWYLRYLQVPNTNPEQQVEVYKVASRSAPKFWAFGLVLAEELAERGHFSHAVQVFDFMYENRTIRDPQTWNNVAYFRALAATELDKALEEVNRALEFDEEEVSFRDTRAWVYYQMGRLTEALADADFAVNRIFEQLGKRDLLPPNSRDASAQDTSIDDSSTAKAKSDQSQSPQVESDAMPSDKKLDSTTSKILDKLQLKTAKERLLWSVGVMVYHRAKILQSLGREKDADNDFQWLRDRGLPTDDRLF